MKPDVKLITLLPKWLPLEGMAFGIRQPTLIGRAEVQSAPHFPLERFDNFLNSLINESLPKHFASEATPHALLQRVFYAAGAIQRMQKIPVFGDSHIVAVNNKVGERGEFFIIGTPYFRLESSSQVIHWLTSTIDQFSHAAASAHLEQTLEEGFEKLLSNLRPYSLKGINTFHFLAAANAKGIPFEELHHPNLFVIGQGQKGRWLHSSMTEQTSSLGTKIAQNKQSTAIVLAQMGIPVPRQVQVKDASDALVKADKIGYPVVVKPLDLDGGLGVYAHLEGPEVLMQAIEQALKYSPKLLLEEHCQGQDYRLTVFRNSVKKILHRQPAGVTGDGKHSVRQLVEALQKTPRFVKYLRQKGRQLLTLDQEALGLLTAAGMTPDTIVETDRFVVLRRKSNISAGGIQSLIEVKDAHPDNLDLAINAATALNLDFAGIDLLIPDIAVSWLESGAVIIEVNARPQIGIDLAPEVYSEILQELVPGDGEIPVHIMLCESSRALPSRSYLDNYMTRFSCNSLSMKGLLEVDGKTISNTPQDGFTAARMLLRSKEVGAALCVVTAREIIRHGSPSQRIDKLQIFKSENSQHSNSELVRRAHGLLRHHEKIVAP